MAFGAPRCYVVRAVSVLGAQAIESEASPARCVTPIDTFAPAAPTSLTAIGGAGAISLIWEANRDPDLAGYLVLRATLPGGDFVPVTPAPIAQTTFSDTAVSPGTRYAYVVLAVDKAGNRSARSNRVEETAR
jgi:fibronectin type 3 domain-containing protein